MTNGPDGTVFSKTKQSVTLISQGISLQEMLQTVNPAYIACVNLDSCLTVQVESLHSLHHLKQSNLPHMLEYAISFGNTIKESLKRVCKWGVYYYTKSSSYYPVPTSSLRFDEIPQLEPLPVKSMTSENISAIHEELGKYMGENSQTAECTYKVGTLPHHAYRTSTHPDVRRAP